MARNMGSVTTSVNSNFTLIPQDTLLLRPTSIHLREIKSNATGHILLDMLKLYPTFLI